MTPTTVALIAPGNMGAAVGRRLSDHGVKVITLLEGRSAASIERAAAAGMVAATPAEIARADFILSILPPSEALPLAERLAAPLRASNHKPLYADCNAVNPHTANRIAAAVEAAGCAFVDGSIIGGPPRANYSGPVIYVSGREARRAEALNAFGLTIRVLPGPVGDASALKMSYGGLTKGLTALGAVVALAATRAGVADALHAELAASQPQLLAWLEHSVPGMFSKAYRWVGEMGEVAGYVEPGPDQAIFAGVADLYERFAADHSRSGNDTDVVSGFFAKTPPAGRD
jgi:3-hydroxyisobutyrate dehydrogenase-like beta-hydroxyacid dehydrogenase